MADSIPDSQDNLFETTTIPTTSTNTTQSPTTPSQTNIFASSDSEIDQVAEPQTQGKQIFFQLHLYEKYVQLCEFLTIMRRFVATYVRNYLFTKFCKFFGAIFLYHIKFLTQVNYPILF